MSDIRDSSLWTKFEPKGRVKLMSKYIGKPAVILSPSKAVLYFSELIMAKLLFPEYVEFRQFETKIGISRGTEGSGSYKVQDKKGSTAHVNVKTFTTLFPFEPGVYEGVIEVMDGGKEKSFNMFVFDTSDHPSKTKVKTTKANAQDKKKKKEILLKEQRVSDLAKLNGKKSLKAISEINSNL